MDREGATKPKSASIPGPGLEVWTLEALQRGVLGCLVRDRSTGRSLGWVVSGALDARGMRFVELELDPVAGRVPPEQPRTNGNGLGHGGPGSEGLMGQVLVDVAGRYMGSIVDVQADAEAGRLRALVVERSPGARDVVTIGGGLIWEDGHWTVVGGGRMPVEIGQGADASTTVGEPDEDWMVGQIATRRVLDRRGQLIVEVGQVITAGTVARANRAGVLHLLESEPSRGR